jgi:hypothetical protein
MSTLEILRQWAQKTETDFEVLKRKFEEYLALQPTTLPAQERERRARQTLYKELRGMLVSPARPQIGIFIGADAVFDMTARIRQECERRIAEDPFAAVRDGYAVAVDSNGFEVDPSTPGARLVPADPRPTLGNVTNRFYRHVLQPAYIRRLYGIGGAKGTPIDQWKPFVYTARSESRFTGKRVVLKKHAGIDELPNFLTVYEFNALVRELNPVIQYASSATTTFKEFKPGLSDRDIWNLLDKALNPWYVVLGDIKKWHEDHAEDPARILVTEGTVEMDPRISEDSNRSHLVALYDESLGFGDIDRVPVWVPYELKSLLNFGRDSRVVVIGRTALGPGYDPTTRQPTQERTRVMINAFGIFARPEQKTLPSGW